MAEILEHTLKDTLPMLPLLCLTYLLLEYLEHKDSLPIRRFLSFRYLAPVGAALLGIIPQCGFSLIAAGLYADHLISLGTLLAVFISTSDEAIPILLAHPEQIRLLIAVIVLKLIIAIMCAYIVDALFPPAPLSADVINERVDSKWINEQECHSHSIWGAALRRTLKIYAFVLALTFILNAAIHTFGEAQMEALLLHQTPFQPFLAALIGLIPNCASSVLLAQLFVRHTLSFGSLLAGLISNAGLGLMVLYRSVPAKIMAVKIALILFFIAWGCGTLVQLCMQMV